MSVTASNPLDSATVNVTVVVAESVVGAVVTDDGIVTSPGENKHFTVTFDALPSDAVVDVRFGDGENTTLSGRGTSTINQMEMSHVYVTPGTYTVTVIAYNDVSQSTARLDVTVSTVRDCKRPKLAVKHVYAPLFYRPYVLQRKDALSLSAEADLDCGSNVRTNNTWTIHEVDPRYGQVVRQVDIDDLPSRTHFDLVVPARFLPYGLYGVTYSVLMDGPSDVFSNQVVTYVQVVKSPLVARLTEGIMSTLVRGWGQEVTLEPGRFSLDPDLDSGEDQVSGMIFPACSLNREVPSNNAQKSGRSIAVRDVRAVDLPLFVM